MIATTTHLTELEKAKLFCYGFGNFYSDRNDYVHSLEYYDQAIRIKHDNPALKCNEKEKLDPVLIAAWFNKGNTLEKLGRYDEAIECYNKAILLDPNNAGIWYSKGLTLTKLKRYEESIEYFDKAIELDPKYISLI